MSARGSLMALPVLLAALLLPGLPAAAAPAPLAATEASAQTAQTALEARVDGQVMGAFEAPEAALAQLQAWAALPEHADAAAQQTLQLGRGLAAALSGRPAEARLAAAALERQGQALAAADAMLVRATLALSEGRAGESTDGARAALQSYARECPAAPACNWRSSWQAHHLLARQGTSTGHAHNGREHALAAAELARAYGDTMRQGWSLAMAADLSATLGDGAAEQRYIARAQRLARLEGSRTGLIRIKLYETLLHQRHGEWDAARRSAEQGLVLAREGASPRMESYLLTNLSDIEVKSGHPQRALQTAERALPVLRRLGDHRMAQVVLHNAALARIALGQGDIARRTLDELLASHAATGATGYQAVVLREFADAFARAGDHASALALYHRERKVAADIMATNRAAALAALSARFDRESQQRRLEQLARENALIGAQLANRAILHKVWIASAAVLVLAVGLVALLYRRVRRINRSLAHNHAFLSAQSRRDPLTGLANRRALHDAAAAHQAEPQFEGALLLVDIDHFKQVNDGRGHASGDLVLVEIARRLSAAVGSGDLLVRWGGEEFLVFMPHASLAQAQALAARVLHAVAGTPVALPDGPLRVTASLGYAGFPLPPAQLQMPLERAVNLADMALYLAKSQGRNRALGVHTVGVASEAELLAVEADFDQAWQDGRVGMVCLEGPADPGRAAAPAAAVEEALPA